MNRRVAVFVAAIVVAAAAGLLIWRGRAPDLPPDIVQANGRIEVERIEIAAKYPGRVATMRVDEGDSVTAGQIVAEMDDIDLRAERAAALAAVHRAEQNVNRAEAEVALREADLGLAEVELRRANELQLRNTGTPAEVDRRTAQKNVTKAALDGARAAVGDAKAGVEVARAQLALVDSKLAEASLKTPVGGRVEYRLTQPGEVIPSGGRVATVLDLGDVFMTVFLPTHHAGRAALGGEARIVLDAAPEYVIPAAVSFVAAEAQFTPKSVETQNEREKLMYRVKLRVDPKLLQAHRAHVKAGMTGVAFVSTAQRTAWPEKLLPRLPNDE
ncbi:MAG: HlyD family efflux transporter periplasmic adaptor subunit [Alsobacter sp.]